MTLRTKLLAAAFMLAMATPASAVSLSLFGGSSGGLGDVLPGNFGPLVDVNGDLSLQPLVGTKATLFASVPAINSPVTSYTSSKIVGADGLKVDSDALVTFTYIGTEAGNTNTTEASILNLGNAFFNSKQSTIGDTIQGVFLGTDFLLDFSFTTSGQPGQGIQTASNAGTIEGDLTLAFGALFNSPGGTDSSIFAFFGDGAGDNDFDDIVIRIDIIADPGNFGVVPLPAALPLYGTGLAIMGFIGWRRKRKSAV